jgi:NADH-quinone oxidoreductase subunit J
MALEAAAFWILATVAVLSAFFVVAARNPVRSVMWLICAFFTSAGLFVLIGAEFLAMLLVVVYVGAVAVLFLFVVMMLDINFTELRRGFLQYLPIGALIGIVLLVELIFVFGGWVVSSDAAAVMTAPAPPPGGDVSNIHALGRLIYTQYIYLFQAAGLILLVAMVGAIVLTLRHREGVRRQKIGEQIARRREDTIEVVKVPSGSGI